MKEIEPAPLTRDERADIERQIGELDAMIRLTRSGAGGVAQLRRKLTEHRSVLVRRVEVDAGRQPVTRQLEKTMADVHYSAATQERLDAAVAWLGQFYGLV